MDDQSTLKCLLKENARGKSQPSDKQAPVSGIDQEPRGWLASSMSPDGADLPANMDAGTLTKSKMIVEIAERLTIPEKEAAAILEHILTCIARAIQAGH